MAKSKPLSTEKLLPKDLNLNEWVLIEFNDELFPGIVDEKSSSGNIKVICVFMSCQFSFEYCAFMGHSVLVLGFLKK